MKKHLNIILIIITVIALMFALGFYKAYKDSKAARQVAEDNFKSTRVKDSTGFAVTLRLTTDQLQQEIGVYLDSINKLNDEKIKLNKVLRFTQFELSKSRVNIPVLSTDTFRIHDTIPIGRKAFIRDSCMSVEVFAPDTGKYIYFTTKLNVTGSIIVYRGKRRNQHSIFGLNLFRTGARLTSAKMNTNCDGAAIEIKDIEIVK